MTEFDARPESPFVGGWQVVSDRGLYVHFPCRELAMALAALLNRDAKSAAEWVEQYRTGGTPP